MKLMMISLIVLAVTHLFGSCNSNDRLNDLEIKDVDSTCECNSEFQSFPLNDTINIGKIIEQIPIEKRKFDRVTVNFNFRFQNECYCIKSTIIIPPDLENRPVGWVKHPKGEVIYVFSNKNKFVIDTNTLSINDFTNVIKQDINKSNSLSFSSNYRTELYGVVIKSALKWILLNKNQSDSDIKYTRDFKEFEIEFFMPDLTHKYPIKDSLY
jgi:hypothetical protein